MPIKLKGSSSGDITLDVPATAGTNTLTLPAVTDTLTGIAATQTLTNKTLTSPVISGPSISGDLNYTGTLTGGTGVINIGSGQVYKDASGNVGINTSSPSVYGKLVSVTGDNATTFAAVGATNMLRVQGYNSTYVGTVVEAVNLAQSANTPMFINASQTLFGISGAEKMRIDSSGNVGIGTSSPTQTAANRTVLSVNGTTTAIVNLNAGGVNKSYFYFDGTNTNVNTATGNLTLQNDSANSVTFNTNGANERMRIDSSGNVGIGTASPGSALEVKRTSGNVQILVNYNGTNTGRIVAASNGNFYIGTSVGAGSVVIGNTANADAMTLDSAGNVGIGTTSPNAKLQVLSPGGWSAANWGKGFYVNTSGSACNPAIGISDATGANNWAIVNLSGALTFNTAPAITDGATAGNERMRIDSNGNLLVGTTSTINGSVCPIQALTTAANQAMYLRNSNAVPYGMYIDYSGAAPNNTTSFFADFRDTGGQRFGLRSNGGIANYSANNVNLSDERTKTDIQDAGNYLAKICSIPVRTFKYKDQSDDILNLGVIAQEVEAVAPELVDVSGFGETPEDGVPLKAIYQTDLQYALMKCIQEQQAIIQSLTDRVAQLEAK